MVYYCFWHVWSRCCLWICNGIENSMNLTLLQKSEESKWQMNRIINCVICGNKREVPKMRWAKYCLSCAKIVQREQRNKCRKPYVPKRSCKYCGKALIYKRRKYCCGSDECKKLQYKDWVARNRKYRTEYEIKRRRLHKKTLSM